MRFASVHALTRFISSVVDSRGDKSIGGSYGADGQPLKGGKLQLKDKYRDDGKQRGKFGGGGKAGGVDTSSLVFDDGGSSSSRSAGSGSGCARVQRVELDN